MIRAIRVSILTLACASTLSLLGQSDSATETAAPIRGIASALAGLGGANVQNLTLTGSSEWIAGSTDESGTFSASCSLGGSSQLNLQLTKGSRSETRQIVNGVPSGGWADSDGVQHPMAQHNLLTSSSWFCPSVALSDIITSAHSTVEFVGTENKNETMAEHYTVFSKLTAAGASNSLYTRLTRMEVFLDPQTQRPLEIDFNIHPDKTMLVDIPVEIHFSNYTETNGEWIPFIVEKYVNGTLSLKLQIESVSAAPSIR